MHRMLSIRKLRCAGSMRCDPGGFDLADGEDREIVFRLGAGSNPMRLLQTQRVSRGPASAVNALEAVIGIGSTRLPPCRCKRLTCTQTC